MFAALLFLTGGVFRLVGSLVVRGPAVRLDAPPGRLRPAARPPGARLDWPGSSQYVLGAFFSLALLFDGLGLIATGFGGRRIVGWSRSDPR